MFQLSVCAELMFQELPIEQRFSLIAEAGFLTEFWRWADRDLDAITADSRVKVNAMCGSLTGSMVHPDGVEEFMKWVTDSLPVAKRLNCRNLILLSGELSYEGAVIHPIASHPATMWITAYKVLCEIAELAEKHDVVYHLEPLNSKVEHAGYPFPKVEDVARLITEVNSPRIKMLFDIYHVQTEEGNVMQAIRDYRDLIGYVHVADVPGRHEPGTGEINYPAIAGLLREVGYDGPVALEASPLKDSVEAMQRFREAFE